VNYFTVDQTCDGCNCIYRVALGLATSNKELAGFGADAVQCLKHHFRSSFKQGKILNLLVTFIDKPIVFSPRSKALLKVRLDVWSGTKGRTLNGQV
jgi:hypothetical protein